MKLLVDARVLTHEKTTGVENYTLNIIDSLKQFLKFEIAVPKFKNKYYCHFWEHFILPFKALKYDVLFSPSNIAPIYLSRKVKLVLTLHDLSFKDFPKQYAFSFRNYYNFLLPINLKRADCIITISNYSKKRILLEYPFIKNKLTVIYHGINKKFHQNQNIEKENYILYVGSLNETKNFTSVLEVFCHLNRDGLKLKMIMPTSSTFFLSRKNISLLEKVKKNENIQIIDYVEQNELVKFYQKAKLFILPSYHESFGFPVLEALACATPVICSKVTALSEVGGDAVLYCDPYDLKDIETKIKIVLDDIARQEDMIKKGIIQSKKFSWDGAASQHQAVFKGTIK